MMVEIKLARDEHFEDIWSIIHDILKRGDTYPFDPDPTTEYAFQIWIKHLLTEDGAIKSV